MIDDLIDALIWIAFNAERYRYSPMERRGEALEQIALRARETILRFEAGKLSPPVVERKKERDDRS